MGKLTGRVQTTGVTLNNSIIHVVNTDDTTQSPSGSSYKADLGQILSLSPRVTGGTYNSSNESIDFSGTPSFTPFSVDVSSLLDDTNTFTTGATLNGTTLEFDRNDLSNAYSVDLSGLTSSFTGQSLSQTLTIGNNTGINDIIVDNGQVVKSNSDNFLDLQNFDDNKVKLSTNGNQNLIYVMGVLVKRQIPIAYWLMMVKIMWMLIFTWRKVIMVN
jgi:hypothetical protein